MAGNGTVGVDREEAARLGRQTLALLEQGTYTSPAGREVVLGPWLARAVARTRSYPPDASLPGIGEQRYSTMFDVHHESTLQVAERLARAGQAVVALNFASAKRPGGGFLNGALAQEESLARSSGLYACLRDQPMYAYHRAQRDPGYSAWVIYSPDVPVFRRDDGRLLEEPWPCAFLTSPAVNVRALGNRRPVGWVRTAMATRIERVLAVAAAHGHASVVLGAWGCGVFGNDPQQIAELFHAALRGPFCGVFERVTFAVLDTSPDQRVIGPFLKLFGS